MVYSVEEIRKDFPILQRHIEGKRNTFLDTAASAQKPQCVMDKMIKALTEQYANVHRGAYYLSEYMTFAYEQSRKTVQRFINAASSNEVVFTRNATESINLVASTWGRKNLKVGDEVLISEAEHHANLVTWQVLRDELGFTLKIFKVADDGSFLWNEFFGQLSKKTKLVAVTAMSNVLGTIFPIKKIAEAAHKNKSLVLVDACQFAVHGNIDVQDMDCDFLAFSGHKTYGPTGIGVLYGKSEILNEMPPYQLGGEMVDNVTYEKTTFDEPPARFEAGTPAFIEAIGLGAALEYMMTLGQKNIIEHEQELVKYTTQALNAVEGLKQIGTATEKGGVFSFVVDGIHPQDLAFILSKEGVAIRTGHHCAEPLVHRFGYESVARASIGLYTNHEDIDILVSSIEKAKKFF